MEKKYEFRKRLLKVHNENVRNYDVKANADDFVFADGVIISLPENADVVLKNAAADFADYLFTSMNLCAAVGKNGVIDFEIAGENPDRVTEFEITVDEKIHINAIDERSAAQALYYLEDLMNERKAPYIKKDKICKKLAFTPRMIRECGYSAFSLPDEYLAQMAHYGFNAILIRYKGDVPQDTPSTEDFLAPRFTEVLERTKKWGIDVYVLSEIPNKYHPEAPEAEAYYKQQYGDLVKNHPGIRGIVMVGESIGFPSDDPNTTGSHRTKSPDNIPLEKPSTGFYPCYDYYKLINIIKKNVRQYDKDFDIVFWSYNWWGGMFRNDDALMKMIDNLPTDITYLVTFELSEQYKMDDVTKFVCDYSISRVGPSMTFHREAQKIKERGIKLYTMASTAGSTWDFGTIPYMPVPQKWIKRYKALFEAQKDYNLAGLLECWSPGFYPSIVSELTKKCYYNKDADFDTILKSILVSHFGENADTVYKALDIWSEASDYIHSTYDNQYGPLRIGTAYPLCLTGNIKSPYSSFWMDNFHGCGPNMFNTIYSVRVDTDEMHWKKCASLFDEGAKLLESIENGGEELEMLANLGRYIYYCVVTVINVHRWFKRRAALKVLTDKKEIERMLEELKVIIEDERKNATESIKCLRKDSRLGYEPAEEYYGGEEAVMWKLKHLDYVLRDEIHRYEVELPL